ncbi:MAG: hypothetical protein RIK87_30830, partial [Fuerstiella sp.]
IWWSGRETRPQLVLRHQGSGSRAGFRLRYVRECQADGGGGVGGSGGGGGGGEIGGGGGDGMAALS